VASNGFLGVMLGEDSEVCDRRTWWSYAFNSREPFEHPIAGDALGHKLRMWLRASVPLPNDLAGIRGAGHELETRASGSLDQVIAVDSVVVLSYGHPDTPDSERMKKFYFGTQSPGEPCYWPAAS
jgi:hypothetical protein